MLNIKKVVRSKKYKKLIQKSGFFDAKYYLKVNHDARVANETPLDHFCKVGLEKDSKPNENFDPLWYKTHYTDIADSEIYPVIHFLRHGISENRFKNREEFMTYQLI